MPLNLLTVSPLARAAHSMFALLGLILCLAAPAAWAQKKAAKGVGPKPVPAGAAKPAATMTALNPDGAPLQPEASPMLVVLYDEASADDMAAIAALARFPGLRTGPLQGGVYGVIPAGDPTLLARIPAAFPELTFLTYQQLTDARRIFEKDPGTSAGKWAEQLKAH